MTQLQLEHAIAGRTGESPRTIHRLGFGLQTRVPEHSETDDPRLVVDCPFCGRAVPYPGRAGDGSPTLAECSNPRCDVYFDFDPSEVYLDRP
jgi:hypothetical protein